MGTNRTDSHAARKEPFVRCGSWLSDPPDVDSNVFLPAAMLGDMPSEEQRVQLLRQVVEGESGKKWEAIEALWEDRSTEHIEALLAVLFGGYVAAARSLRRFADDDARVRPALIAALRAAPLSETGVLAGIVGLTGGTGALDALRIRLREVGSAIDESADDMSSSRQRGTTAALAHAILCLDPDALEAAEWLVRVHRESAPSERWSIVERMTDVIGKDLMTAAVRLLRREVDGLLHTDDAYSFLVAAPVLAREHRGVVIQRCAEVLRAGHPSLRSRAINALGTLPFPNTVRGLAVLVRWLAEAEPPTAEALWIAGLAHEFLDPSFTRAILKEALDAPAPSLRFDAARYIEQIASEPEDLLLLAEAGAREPDPLLKREMERICARAASRSLDQRREQE